MNGGKISNKKSANFVLLAHSCFSRSFPFNSHVFFIFAGVQFLLDLLLDLLLLADLVFLIGRFR